MAVKQALLVGMDRYRDAAIHDLRYAVEDARLMGYALENAGFETRFLHDAPDQRVVRTTQRMVADLGPEDLFVLYFSGHGVSVRNRHLLLCEEAEHRLLKHGRGGVWVDELKEVTATFGGHRAFILDSCRDALLVRKGTTTRMGDVSGLRTLVDEDEENQAVRPGGLTILCSCDEDDMAQESEDLGQGLFSRALLGCLNEALCASRELCLDGALVQSVAGEMHRLATKHALSVTQRPWVKMSGVSPALVAGAPQSLSQSGDCPVPPVRSPRRRPRPVAVSWWVVLGDEERGPLDSGKVEALIGEGKLTRASGCWRGGMEDWAAMGQVAEWQRKFPGKATPRLASPHDVPPRPYRHCAGEVKRIGLPGELELELVWCPPGEFLMGSPGNELGGSPSECPQRRATLACGFWLGRYPVTQAQWKALTGETPSGFVGPDRPVEQVSFGDCQRFLAALNSRTSGGVFRLPSEAEWEYACRAGTTSALYTGEELTRKDGRCRHLSRIAWYCKNSRRKTHPVGELVPNAWGLHDMLGNVWECCEDRWHDGYTHAPMDGSAWGDGFIVFRVSRGGSCLNDASSCRAASRRVVNPNDRYNWQGLRLVFSPAVH